MKPCEIAQLAPHYAAERGITETGPIHDLHTATTRFNDVVSALGQPVETPDNPIFEYLKQYLTLDRDYEAFFDAYLMPVHDDSDDGGKRTFSRFLVIDTRNPFAESKFEPNPSQRMRAYFLLLTPSPKADLEEAVSVFPYYVIADQEIGYGEQHLGHEESHVFHARYDADRPLDMNIEPKRIYELEPYAAMATELQRAADALTR